MRTETPRILATDDDWIVVDKPSGWLTIPPSAGRASAAPVLVEWLRQEMQKTPEGSRDVWTVHRIDRETSGLVLFARSAEAHRRGSLWFQKHEVRKEYECLAVGSPPAPVFRIREPIAGQPASTQIEVRERYSGVFLARVLPTTGRRHQIRIHLSKAGYPLCGDARYGGPSRLASCLEGADVEFGRVALHAAKLELPGGARFEAPWAEDFSGWVAALRKARV